MKIYFQKSILILTFIFISFIGSGCDGSLNPLDLNIFTPSQDVSLGLQLDSAIRNNSTEYPLYNDASANGYLQGIVNKITGSALIEYKGTFAYKVQIIRDDKTVNAFATPGGFIYVYTGLLKFVDNEATIAGVLAHEIAHAERRHASKRMTKAYGAEFLIGLLLGNDPSEIEKLSANLLTGLALLQNSRDDEYEADEYSFKYLQTSEWYPGAIKFFFDKINDNSGSDFLVTLLSTHPLPADRITAVNDMIKNANLPTPNESNLFANRYSDFVKKLP